MTEEFNPNLSVRMLTYHISRLQAQIDCGLMTNQDRIHMQDYRDQMIERLNVYISFTDILEELVHI